MDDRSPQSPDPRPGPRSGPHAGPDPPGPGPGPDEVWDVLARWRAEGRRFVLATVVETRGFTPRRSGARMLIAADGAFAGTIGGGAIEHVVRAEAARLLTEGGDTLLRRHLTQELGMCCGGEMAVHLEAIEPAPRLILLGAGTIARALAPIAHTCGFDVTVVDARAEWADAGRFPGCRVIEREPEEALRELAPGERDYVVIATHDHGLDQRLVQIALPRPLRFLGMIGSRPKQRKFALRLRARGFSDAEIARLHSPLGFPIGAETPEEIAVSAMAAIIAVRRGAAPPAPWAPPAGAGRPEPDARLAAGEPSADAAARSGGTMPETTDHDIPAAVSRLLEGIADGRANDQEGSR